MKKFLVLMLTVMLILSSFAGCASEESNGGAQTAEPSAEAAAIAVGDPFGTADAPVEITMIGLDLPPSEPDIQGLVKVIEEKMAEQGQFVKINLLEVPSGAYEEAVPVAVRTGQIQADIIYFQGGDKPIADEGLLEDMTPYVEQSKYLKDLMQASHKQTLANYPYLLWLAPARVAVPMVKAEYATMDSVKAVLADPTIDNYTAMFEDFVNQGISDTALTTFGDTTRIDSIFNQAFGVTSTFVKTDAGYVSYMVSDAERDKLAYYADLYKKGLIDPEYITNKWDMMEEKFYSGKASVMAGTGGITNIYNNKMVQATGDEIIVLPPAKGVAQAYKAVNVSKETRGFAISADSPVKVEAFAILDFMASEEGRIIDRLGLEGVHYNVTADGVYETTEKHLEWWPRIWDTYKNVPDLNYATPIVSAAQNSANDLMGQYFAQDNSILFPDTLLPQVDAASSLYRSYSADVITGKKDISTFDEYKEEWYRMGGQAIEDYANEVLK